MFSPSNLTLVQEHTKTLLEASTDVGLEINAEKTEPKYKDS
jgi:hypothetical protein